MNKWHKVLVGSGIFICIILMLARLSLITATSKKQDEKKEKTIEVSIERHPKPNGSTTVVDKMPEENNFGSYDLRYADISKCDLTKEKDSLLRSDFSSITVWPEILPDGFEPDKIMERYKNPGLKIRNLHQKGITGKDVGIAIIDQTLLVDHVEYKNQLKYYREGERAASIPAEIHGAAVASIAVGNTTGVAPEADLYFFAESFMQEDIQISIANDILQVLALNKKLPDDKKIRVISLSWGGEDKNKEGYDMYIDALKKAKSECVFVLSTSIGGREDMKGENLYYMGLGRKALSDPDDYSSYIRPNWENVEEGFAFGPETLCAPMDNMCIAAPTGNSDYAVYSVGGLSWSTPYLAGVYALACQVRPEITYKEFWEVAMNTAVPNKTDYNGKHYEISKIINPEGIMNSLQK